jgi:integrase
MLYPWEFYEGYHKDPYFVCMWYTGLRISELAGIYPENIHLDEDIPYFDIKRQPNRLLKNSCSVRQVPIHPACETYARRLFFSKAKRPGASWSYKFGKNLRLPTGDAAHSLRHSLTSRMNEAEIIDRVQDAILGHGAKSMTAKYGKVTLETKYKALQKLR